MSVIETASVAKQPVLEGTLQSNDLIVSAARHIKLFFFCKLTQAIFMSFKWNTTKHFTFESIFCIKKKLWGYRTSKQQITEKTEKNQFLYLLCEALMTFFLTLNAFYADKMRFKIIWRLKLKVSWHEKIEISMPNQQ